jgi:hypothetical protein
MNLNIISSINFEDKSLRFRKSHSHSLEHLDKEMRRKIRDLIYQLFGDKVRGKKDLKKT